MFSFLYSEDFLKCLKKLSNHAQKQTKERLRFFIKQENPLFYAKKLKGMQNIYRFRIGSYRIIFELENDTIILLLIKHRKDIYR